MSIRVALMGFGRMGRNVFRAIYPRDDIEVVAINDIAHPSAMEYLLRYDSLQGRFRDPVKITDGYLYAKGHRIPVLHETEPGAVPWYDYGVDVVVEATGRYRSRPELEKHLKQGADRVVLVAPPQGEIDAIHICGVHPAPISREYRLISCGSSTSNAVALMVKALDDAFGVEEGFFTAVHAYTNEQSLIDAPSSHALRLSRAAMESIVPVESWTATAIQQIFPKLQGKFAGGKLNVPVPDASCADLVTTLSVAVSPRDINEVFRSAAGSTLRDVLDYTEEPIVSRDVVGVTASCLFDSQATMVVDGKMVKTLGWYHQGGGLAFRIVDVIRQLGPRRVEA